MIVTDEEVGGFDGAERLADAGYLPKVLVLPDGGSDWNLEGSAKGIWFATIEAPGKNAHGSRPWLGDNAIDTLMVILQECKKLFPAKPSMDTNTINVGLIRGGKAINQVPAAATASIDTRFINPEEQKRILFEVEKIAKKYGATLTTEVEAAAVVNDPLNPYLAAFVTHTEEAIGRPIEWVVSNAGHDGRHFAKHGVPLAVGYPAGANHHGQEEYLEKSSLQIMEQIFHRYLLTVARKPSRAKRPVTAQRN
jgi:succinyl-diaminopimelate desuccinylase